MNKILEKITTKPSDAEMKSAVSTILKWIGEDVNREGLLNTPDKVLQGYQKFFSGYNQDPAIIIGEVFEKATSDQMVVLSNIKFTSFCEHHMLPIEGHVSIAYLPTKGVVGFGRIVKLVEVFSRRLQIQERMTSQIAEALQKYLYSDGVAVSVTGSHNCIRMLEEKQSEVSVYTEKFLGAFNDNNVLKTKFYDLTSNSGGKNEVL